MKPANIRLQQSAIYGCNPRNWRTVLVTEGDEILTTATPIGADRWRVTVYRQGTKESYVDSFRLIRGETWEHIAHSLLTDRGWYSPWEVVP